MLNKEEYYSLIQKEVLTEEEKEITEDNKDNNINKIS